MEWVVKWFVEKLDSIEYRGQAITLKSDQEPAIKALKMAVAAKRVGSTTPVESPVRESKSNGAVERAIRVWQGQLRTTKNKFEDNTDEHIPVGHPLMGWLVLWAGGVLLEYVVRSSGRTAYEGITGHRVKHPIVMFGERLNFKLDQDESKRRRMKTETDWSTGIFVGVDPRTSEALMISEEGFFKCRTVRRIPREYAFDAKCLEEAKTPMDEFVNKGAMSSFPEVRTNRHVVATPAPIPESLGKTYIPRRTRVMPDDFVEFEYTDRHRRQTRPLRGVQVQD